MFPYLTGNKRLGVNRLEILFEAPGANPSAHHIVEFLVGQYVEQLPKDRCDCDIHSVVCVSDAAWPGLFYGVLEFEDNTFGISNNQDIGMFKFPKDVGDVTDIFLLCGYELL
ncbi:MAG: hypothetical protein AAF808_10870 [Cyanobacteria bacterium P01_D01_bin.2]